MKWSEKAWEAIEPIYNAIIEMPFIVELKKGTLEIEKFEYYMQQDSKYLENFGKTLSLLASKSYEVKEVSSLIKFAENAILAERALHQYYFEYYNITPTKVMEPANHHYTSHIKAVASFESLEVGMAAVLPCFWIYKKVGDHIYKNQKKENNPYQKWIDTYAGEEFGLAVQEAIEMCDELALNSSVNIQERMTQAFILSSKMEYEFWDAAYHLKRWKSF